MKYTAGEFLSVFDREIAGHRTRLASSPVRPETFLQAAAGDDGSDTGYEICQPTNHAGEPEIETEGSYARQTQAGEALLVAETAGAGTLHADERSCVTEVKHVRTKSTAGDERGDTES